ncbi:2-keto-4-pentenoate hydratase [Embleya sp. NBC_00896]|uniref:2-keto-4-pentenoate hydratase n=1 Tax=Embleya sp. NBC_00896 TaxID=2975961 RepID=UPI002F91B7BF|nr:2-keto-4-pentenoate hydratase [Embleya sp. NBC_00896]
MADLSSIATELLNAYTTRRTLAPLSQTYDGLSLDDAYEIQQIQIRRRLDSGTRVIGFKVGLTSTAMQEQFGVGEPDFGHLLSDMLFAADAAVPTERFLQPRAEPEIALVLSQALKGPDLSVTDVVSATAYALPAIEIIDSRIIDWRIGLHDTIADNASSGGLVLGQTPTSLAGLDLSLIGCVFRRNGRILHTGAGAAVLGSPLHSATWLANTLTRRGVELAAGSIILTGSLTAAVTVAPGDSITAALDHLGSVTAVFG